MRRIDENDVAGSLRSTLLASGVRPEKFNDGSLAAFPTRL